MQYGSTTINTIIQLYPSSTSPSHLKPGPSDCLCSQ